MHQAFISRRYMIILHQVKVRINASSLYLKALYDYIASSKGSNKCIKPLSQGVIMIILHLIKAQINAVALYSKMLYDIASSKGSNK